MILNLTGVSRRFESPVETVVAVDQVTFAADCGEFICIYGASGSGKSTLLNLIAGIEPADEGEIQVAGKRLQDLDEDGRAQLRLHDIGVVYQDHELIGEFTAEENVALPLEARGVDSRSALETSRSTLGRVDLERLSRRFPHEMSGGQRQRVGIARALVGGRQVLLADEPTGALDSAASVQLLELLSELSRSGVLVIVCTHDELCRPYATRVLEMSDGRLASAASEVVVTKS